MNALKIYANKEKLKTALDLPYSNRINSTLRNFK